MSGESLCACAEPLSFEDALAVETGLDAACRCDPRTCGGGGYSSDTPMVMQAGIRALAASLRTGAPLLRLGPSDHAAGLSAVDVERRALEALVLALVADGDEVGAVQAREELVSLTDVQEEGSRSVVVSGFALRSVGEQLLAVVSRDGADTNVLSGNAGSRRRTDPGSRWGVRRGSEVLGCVTAARHAPRNAAGWACPCSGRGRAHVPRGITADSLGRPAPRILIGCEVAREPSVVALQR